MKQAVTMATVLAADSMSMTTIWYFAADRGSAPASSWPVIMPGNVTMPAADMFASTGVMPAPMPLAQKVVLALAAVGVVAIVAWYLFLR